jgi:hypothetical protein
MSVGFFMGIRKSYTAAAQDVASDFLTAINGSLAAHDLPAYADPPQAPDVYVAHLFGRSALDHHGAQSLRKVASMAAPDGHLALVAANPFRLAFLPMDFEKPLETDHQEKIWNQQVNILAGSAARLLDELRALTPSLGITLNNGDLADDVAHKINECEALHEGDTLELAENERTAWLLLFEGARLALTHKIALSLAG